MVYVVRIALAAFVLITAVLLAVLLIAMVASCLISELRLRRRARHDYRVARGTQHLKQLEGPLAKLEHEIQVIRRQIQGIEQQLHDLGGKRQDELRAAACQYLVNHRLTDVDGIGPQLQQRIVRSCFRGSLRDLHHAERVRGVGPRRRAAIMRWVQARERELPALMERAFPGRDGVEKAYRTKVGPLRKRLAEREADLKEKEDLHKSTKKAVETLESVNVACFRRALSRRSSDEPVPSWYLEGVYPAWGSAPDWFTTVLTEYGG